MARRLKVPEVRRVLGLLPGGGMDPITAALNLAAEIVKSARVFVESIPPEERVAVARIHLENLQRIQAFFDRVQARIGQP